MLAVPGKLGLVEDADARLFRQIGPCRDHARAEPAHQAFLFRRIFELLLFHETHAHAPFSDQARSTRKMLVQVCPAWEWKCRGNPKFPATGRPALEIFVTWAGLPDDSAGGAKKSRLPAAFLLAVLAGRIPRVARRLLLGQKLHQLFRLFALFGFGGGLGLFLFPALAFFRFAG